MNLKMDTTRAPRYERLSILLLALGFGLVGLDRWIIAPLFPAIMQDLHFNYADFGNAIGILGFTWGIFSIVLGNISDRFGRRIVLLPSLLLFSLMAGLTGTISSISALILIRAVMGATEGAYLSSSVAAVADVSPPSRRGRNQGIMLSTFPLFGLALAPIIATQLLAHVSSWRWVFAMVAVPGLILAAIMWRALRNQHPAAQSRQAVKVPWVALLRSRNLLLAMASLVCAMSCIFVLASMAPNYLQDFLKVPSQQMGFIMSGLGVGGFAGEWLVGAASDRFGRRPMTLLSFIGSMLSVIALQVTGANPGALFVEFVLASFFSFGVLALMTGPVATEAVPVALIASAIGLVSGTGEIVGGGLVPAIAGHVAQRYGIQNVFYVTYAGLAVGAVLCLFFTETAPGRRVNSVAPSLAEGQ
jgi:predicted MFS family arabinose efflux permease